MLPDLRRGQAKTELFQHKLLLVNELRIKLTQMGKRPAHLPVGTSNFWSLDRFRQNR
jgi:hypothetical protein